LDISEFECFEVGFVAALSEFAVAIKNRLNGCCRVNQILLPKRQLFWPQKSKRVASEWQRSRFVLHK